MRSCRLLATSTGAITDKSPERAKSMPKAWRNSGLSVASSGLSSASIHSCISTARVCGVALLKSLLPVKRMTGASTIRASTCTRVSQAPPPCAGMQNSSSSSFGR
ncbi:hypothetical protein D3C71_1667880 [compost metagenome]